MFLCIPSRDEGGEGGKLEVLHIINEKNNIMSSVYLKLSSQVKVKPVTYCDFCKVLNVCYGQSLWLVVPVTKNLATPLTIVLHLSLAIMT
jgi:hypothetical protein